MAYILLAFIICFLGIYVFIQGSTRIVEEWRTQGNRKLVEMAQNTFLPVFSYVSTGSKNIPDGLGENENWISEQVMNLFPLSKYVSEQPIEEILTEDTLTYEMLLAEQAKDEERISEDLDTLVDAAQASNVIATPVTFSMDKLRDYNYLLSKFYTVDSTTMTNSDQLNADKFMAKNMKISQDTTGPKVLIFHTHSQEAFADSIAGDVSTSIVGMGAYLAERLNEKGIETLHHDAVYDLVNGKLDRSNAYELSEIGVREILNQYPSIEVVIDLHRDGVREDMHLITEIDGKQTARIMFFNGLSRTKTNGDISYLYNPYIQDNLAFSFQMQLTAESMYPGLARKIYLKGYRYSLHMMPKSLLIEAGAQTNTVEELRNAMDLLAEILNQVLVG